MVKDEAVFFDLRALEKLNGEYYEWPLSTDLEAVEQAASQDYLRWNYCSYVNFVGTAYEGIEDAPNTMAFLESSDGDITYLTIPSYMSLSTNTLFNEAEEITGVEVVYGSDSICRSNGSSGVTNYSFAATVMCDREGDPLGPGTNIRV
jgi:hypothetical protein